MNQLFWLRTDLRVSDNTALTAAMNAGPTVALYLITPKQWLAHNDAPCKVDFWLRNLAELSVRLSELNVPLLIRHVGGWQAVPEVIASLCRAHDIDTVHVNDEYGVNEQRRDEAVAQALTKTCTTMRRHLLSPSTIVVRVIP